MQIKSNGRLNYQRSLDLICQRRNGKIVHISNLAHNTNSYTIYDDSSWENASIYERDITISPEMIEPDRKTETIVPISITGKNPYAVDMETNYTGCF